ncbi:unnamed protein product [Moneuplotes crassus]|uniref:Uncharacterized protein n=1 Tax=Euplotes crassus TaxID=5936 RepID=A0AAD1X6B2_EUPCR|nr:unnamed protein product [Moneuplotes crassus]
MSSHKRSCSSCLISSVRLYSEVILSFSSISLKKSSVEIISTVASLFEDLTNCSYVNSFKNSVTVIPSESRKIDRFNSRFLAQSERSLKLLIFFLGFISSTVLVISCTGGVGFCSENSCVGSFCNPSL